MNSKDERAILRSFLAEAIELALLGRIEDGYRRLDLGLAWAEARSEGYEECAAELLNHYRRALVQYSARFGVAFSAPEPLTPVPAGYFTESPDR
jgi:hypothetical protein